MNVKIIKIIAIISVFLFASYNMYQFYQDREEEKLIEAERIAEEQAVEAERQRQERVEREKQKTEQERIAREEEEKRKRAEAERLEKIEQEKLARQLELEEKRLIIEREKEERRQKKVQEEREREQKQLAEKIEYARTVKDFDGLHARLRQTIKNTTPAYVKNNKQDVLDYKFNFRRQNHTKLLSESANPLHLYAMIGERPDVIQAFVEIGFDINGVTKEGVSPLLFASAFNSAEMVEALISQGAKLDTREFFKDMNALHVASAYNPKPEVVETLVSKHGMDIEQKANGLTPLLLASIQNQNLQVVEKLLDLEADTSVVDSEGKDASMHVQDRIEYRGEGYRRISEEYDEEVRQILLLSE